MLAQASISVPSTEKCSSDSSGLTFGSARIAARKPRDVAGQQTVAVLGEHRHVPHRRIHRQADEPAEHHVVGDLLHQLPLRAHREQRLQQKGAQQLLRRDRVPAARRIHLLKPPRQPLQGRVHQRADGPQGMVRRHKGFRAQIAEHRSSLAVDTTHSSTFPRLNSGQPLNQVRARLESQISAAC